MFDVLSAISFSNLPALLLAGLAPFLIFAYRKQDKLTKKNVSSLFLLSDLPYSPVSKKKIKLPPRFFLYILALGILSLIAAWPFMSKEHSIAAVLIDNSMSTEALLSQANKSENNTSYTTRFELLNEKLIEKISKSKASDFDIYTSSPILRKISEEPLSKSKAKSLVSSTAPSSSSDNLSLALSELLSKKSYGSVISASDREILNEKEFSNLKNASLPARSTNIYIKDFQVVEKNSNKFIEVLISSSSSEERLLEVDLSLSSGTAEDLRLEEKSSLTLNSLEKEKKITFNIKDGLLSGKDFLKIELEANDDINSISKDDTAFLTLKSQNSKALLVISPIFRNKQQTGLSKVKNLNFDLISPDDLANLPKEKQASYKSLIFHQSAPFSLPDSSSLFILPPSDNSFFPGINSIISPKISSWDDSHSVMSYLNTSLLKIESVQTIKNPPWASSVLNTEQGSILSLGEYQGQRYGAVGFELLPFEGRQTPSSSVLFLNLLGYLSKEQSFTAGHLTGEKINIAEELSIEGETPSSFYNPLNDPIQLDDDSPTLNLSLSGPYRFNYQSGKVKNLIANSYFEEESKTAENLSISIPISEQVSEFSSEKRGKELWSYLAKILLLILSLDLLIRMIKKEDKAG